MKRLDTCRRHAYSSVAHICVVLVRDRALGYPEELSMSCRSVAVKWIVLRMAGVLAAAGATLAAQPKVTLLDESAGIDAIAQTLISAFDQVDIIALGETHQWRLDTDLRIALVRHPDFAKKVRYIEVEFGSTTEQPILDRYIRGENVPRTQLEQVWKTTTKGAKAPWDSPA